MKTRNLTLIIVLLLISKFGISQIIPIPITTTHYIPRIINSNGDLDNSIITQYNTTIPRIGIGAPIPAARLHVDATTDYSIARFANTKGGADIEFYGSTTYSLIRNRASAAALIFYTNNQSNQLYLSPEGNVGIRRDPTTSFEVYNGTLKISGSASRGEEDARFVMDMGPSTLHNFIELRNSNGTRFSVTGGGRVGIRQDAPATTLDINNGTLKISGTDDLSEENARFVMDMGTSSTQRFMELRNSLGTNFVVDGNGMVGIGTSSPHANLHVKGDFNAVAFEPALVSGSNYVFDLDFDNPITGTHNWTIRHHINDPVKGNSLLFWSRAGAPLIMVGADAMLGVGTLDPSTRLEVKDGVFKISGTDNLSQGDSRFHMDLGSATTDNFIKLENQAGVQFIIDGNGKVWAKEIEITLQSPLGDFVFEEDYDLLSIYELELFVKNNKHLPNVPSASDVQANGINLGEMDNILLQKIEELTLYTIEQQKVIDELRTEIDLIKTK